MADVTLLNFIKSTLSQGYDEIDIRKGLLSKGWPQNLIDEAFEEVNNEQKKEVLDQKEVSETITPQELKETFSQPKQNVFEKIGNKISLKGITVYSISFIAIFLILSFTVLIFYYMTGLMDYTVLDPASGNLVNGKCYQENCSDMKESAYNVAKDKLLFSSIIGLLAAFILVLVYKFIKWKTTFLWIVNILYFAFLAVIIYLWISFTASLS